MNKKLIKDMRKAAQVNNANGSTPVNSLSFLSEPKFTLDMPDITSDISQGPTIIDFKGRESIGVDTNKVANEAYNYLMSTANDTLKSLGYFVTTDNGSVFKGTVDRASVYLPIQDIQRIENELGTPGALLLKLNQPALAKDTAGYEGGASSTGGGTPVVPPVQTVADLPPVVKDPTGVIDFDSTLPVPSTGTGGTLPTGTSQQGILPAGKYWWLPYLVAVVVIIVYLKFRK